jgi:parallel beta-helix repeat protein
VGLCAVAWGGCAVGQTGSSALTDNGTSVNGYVISNAGGTVEYWARYGLTTSYGSETAHATITTQKNVLQPVEIEIAGLARSTTYHFQLCANDGHQSGGPGCGDDASFTTESFTCGEPITTSVRLTGRVFCESKTPLVVGADGIDINLAGNRVDTPTGSGGGSDAVRNDGFDDVTIRNGSLTGATRLTGASGNLIRKVHATGGSDVIHIEGGAGNAVRASTIDARGSGVAADSDDLIVANNHITAALGAGIRILGDRFRVANNELRITGSPFTAAIELTGSNGQALGNDISGPWRAGGLVLLGGANNVLGENTVSGTGGLQGTLPANAGDGIFVGGFTYGTLLRSNLVHDNTGDGIEVQATNARLRDNSATVNGDFGIDAAAGVTDLGGNFASGNGNPLQCRNVFCS